MTTSTALMPFLNTALPSFAEADAGLGNENVGADSLTTPRLKLLQDLSPEVKKVNAAYVAGAEPGDMLNSVTGEIYKELYLLNLKFREEVVIFRKKVNGGGGGLLGKFDSMVEADNFLAENGLQKEGVELIYQHVHTCLMLDVTGDGVTPTSMIEVPLKSSGLSTSRKWNTEIQLQNPQAPRFASVWKLAPTLASKGDNSWFKLDCEFVGWAPEALYNEAKKLHSAL